MTTLYDPGDSIEGEKIYFCFGLRTGDGARGSLSRNGTAVAVKPLKGPRSGAPVQRPSIACRTASYACGALKDKGKTTVGAHRSVHGYLLRGARCEIKTPKGTLPDNTSG